MSRDEVSALPPGKWRRVDGPGGMLVTEEFAPEEEAGGGRCAAVAKAGRRALLAMAVLAVAGAWSYFNPVDDDVRGAAQAAVGVLREEGTPQAAWAAAVALWGPAVQGAWYVVSSAACWLWSTGWALVAGEHSDASDL